MTNCIDCLQAKTNSIDQHPEQTETIFVVVNAYVVESVTLALFLSTLKRFALESSASSERRNCLLLLEFSHLPEWWRRMRSSNGFNIVRAMSTKTTENIKIVQKIKREKDWKRRNLVCHIESKSVISQLLVHLFRICVVSHRTRMFAAFSAIVASACFSSFIFPIFLNLLVVIPVAGTSIVVSHIRARKKHFSKIVCMEIFCCCVSFMRW